MMKKVVLIMLAALILFVFGSSFSGCVPKAAQAAEKPIIIKVSMSGSPMAMREKVYTDFLWPEIEKRTKGQVKFELYYAESLIKLKDGLSGAGRGLADIAAMVPAYTTKRTPFGHVVFFPYQCPDNILAGYRGLADAVALYPEIFTLGIPESNCIPFFPTFAGRWVIASKKPVRKMEDLKGLRFRGVGRTGAWLKTMGATVSSVPYTEVYTAIDRNTIDGGQFYFGDICTYKISEVVKYVTDPMSGYLCTSWYVINADLWNRLPADVQKVFMDIRPELYQKLAEGDAEEMANCVEELKKRGVEVINLPPEEAAQWKEKSMYLRKEFAKDIDQHPALQKYLKEKGLTGQMVVDKIDELVKKHADDLK